MPGDPRLRASDADRERVAQLLREHHAVGRLTAEEFDARLEKVFTARTLGELDALLADMPAIDLYQLPSAGIRPAQRAVRVRDRDRSGALVPRQNGTWGAFAAVTALLAAAWVIIGVATGGLAWLPWFLLVIIPWGLVIARRQQP